MPPSVCIMHGGILIYGEIMATLPINNDTTVSLVKNNNIFYVTDEHSKKIFEEDLGLPFYSFTINEYEYITRLLKSAKVKIKILPASKIIVESTKPILNEWVEDQPFKRPIKKKFELSQDFSKITFTHLGPAAKTIALKSAAIEKCQDSIQKFLIRFWQQLEPHFYRVMVFDSSVETETHRPSGGTIIRISYPLVFNNVVSSSEDADEEDDDE